MPVSEEELRRAAHAFGWDEDDELSAELQTRFTEQFPEIDNAKQIRYLAALSITPAATHAARLARVSVHTVYNWLDEKSRYYSADFTRAHAVAKRLGIQAAEAEAWRRATKGTLQDVYGSLGQGLGSGVVGQRYEKSDTLLIFALKGADPKTYRERVEHSGPEGGPIEVVQVERVIIDPAKVKE